MKIYNRVLPINAISANNQFSKNQQKPVCKRNKVLKDKSNFNCILKDKIEEKGDRLK